MRLAAALAMGCLALVLPARAEALDVGGRIIVASDVRGPATAPISASAAYDETLDRFLVTWLQQGVPIGDTTNVWGRLLTSDGEPIGPPFLAATVGTGIDGRDARSVDVHYDPVQREFLLTITGLRSSSFQADEELYAQWLDDAGERIGEAIPISWVSAGTIGRPSVIHDPARQRFVVAYEVDRPSIGTATVALQSVRRGEIGAPVLPLGAVALTRPSLALGPAGLLLSTLAGERSDRLRILALDETLAVAGSPTDLLLSAPPSAGPRLHWHPEGGSGRLIWADAGGLLTTAVGAQGTTGDTTTIPSASPVRALDLLPVAREGRWLVVTESAGSGARAALELTDGGGQRAGTAVSAQEPEPFGDLVPGGGTESAMDRTRQWALVPYSARTPTGRALLARVVGASQLPTPPAPPAAQPAVARCGPGAVLYLPRTGSACGPSAVGAFTVAAIMTRKRSRMVGLVVRPTTRQHRVRVECVARCGRLRPVLSTRGRRGATDVMFGRWRAPRGATLEIRIEQEDATTRFRRFTVRGQFPFLATASSAGCRLPIGLEAPC